MTITPTAPSLRPYQREQIAAICKHLAGGQNRLLVQSPTGTGKTVTFAAMLRWPGLVDWLAQFPERERKMLVIAHRQELLDQAADKILAANPDLQVSVEQADRHAHAFSDVIVASIQTLSASKFRRLKELMRRHTFRIVIVDEAHHASADTYRTALTYLGFLPPSDASDMENFDAARFEDIALMTKALDGWDAISPKDRLLVGVTATPNRSDAIGLGCVFQTIAYTYALKTAIDDGWLVPIMPWVIETRDNLDDVKTIHGDFNQGQLAAAVNNGVRNELAVAAWHERAEGLSTIVFSVDVAHAHALAGAFNADGVTAVALSGETDRVLRRQYLEAYIHGEILVLANCMVLTEGTDLPATGCILHAKPTKSATLYAQMTGRGLRIHPGKTQCVVIDIVDIARKHSLQMTPVLYGLPPGIQPDGGQTLDELEALLAAFMEQHPHVDIAAQGRVTLAQLNAIARKLDLWSVRPLGVYGEGLSMNWLRTADEAFKLSYPWRVGDVDGTETLSVEPDMLGHFAVVATYREHQSLSGPRTTPPRQRTLVQGVSAAAEALRLAEAYVGQERAQVQRLKDREAPWRSRPASSKQMTLLKKFKVPVIPANCTMGAASDLIDVAMSRRRS